ncbi:MAG TPA: FG-GAP-like repeat-containing protein [Terracidiphilus sp.]|nr:FG-GAP-like repeat-containing protein [Terracidiphilus sp.]
MFLTASLAAPAQSKVLTTTTLAVSSSSGPVTTVPSGTIITLTAKVTPASGTIRAAQVTFCDALAKYCTDIHVLGTAQITSAGTATLKLRPGIGSHSYKAVFPGTSLYAGSTSSASALAVTGTIPQLSSATSINETGSWGAYALSATVTETGNTVPPTGLVSFLDTNHGNAVLGTGTLGAGTRGVAWTNVNTSAQSVAGVSYAVADLNGDGIPDLFVEDYFGTYDVLLGKGDGTFTVVGSPFGPYSQTGSFVVGDFNNDGIPDVAAINGTYYGPSNTITIFLGNGDGTFTVAGSSPAVGMSPSGITTADINGDGNADLVVSQTDSSGKGEMAVFLGNGDGTFTQAPSPPSVGSTATSIVPADINGDGKPDLVLSGNGGSGITILLGKGDGTFTVVAGPGQAGEAIASVADLNNDGIPDLVFPSAPASYLTVFLGNGDGTFTQAPSSPKVNLQIGPSAIADFNQDGIPDIVYAIPGTASAGILFGKGDGTFVQAPATITYAYDFSGNLVVADFNGDGWPDVLTEDGNSRTVIDSLTRPTETATASATVFIALAGTHLADASYAGDSNYNPSISGTIALWGAPSATITALTLTSAGTTVSSVTPGTVVTLTATVTAGASPVTAGQVNFCDASASHCTDIHLLGTAQLKSNGTAAYKFVPGSGQHSYKAMFVENGLGTSSSSNVASLSVGPAKAPVYTDMTSITATGVPGDYSLTATVEGFGGSATPTGSVSFLDTSFSNTVLATAPLSSGTAGTGWLISQTAAAGSNPIAEVSGDFNGDGIPDVAILSTGNTSGETGTIALFFGKGDGTFSAGPTIQVTTSNLVAYTVMIGGDFNGDGKMDLAVLSPSFGYDSDNVTTYLGNGDGTFSASQVSTVPNLNQAGGDVIPGAMVAGDFNGDGKIDLALVGDYANVGGVNILFGNGDGTFKAGTTFDPNHGFGQVATGDFNGDGIPDLVATNYFSPGGATVLLGKGDGTFSATLSQLPIDTFAGSIVVGDFNGDGKLDLAFGFTGAVEIYLGNGDGTFNQASGSPVTGAGMSLVAGDFNHDGKVDLAGIDNYNDQVDLFLGAGDGTYTETVSTPNVSQIWLGPFAIVAADFNGDGVPDLAMLTKNVNTISILMTEPTETVSATVNGIAPVGSGTHNVEASYPGDSNYGASVSSAAALTAGLAPLVISPAAGTYSSVQTITLTESVPGATIYYLAYGIVNTNGFVPYSGPIPLTQGGTETIQAYASETGYQQSNYVLVTYTLVLPATATPTISPATGYYAGPQTVTISDSDTSAKIYYTTNGAYPTTSSNLYSGPITVSASETLVARAVSYAHAYSLPVSAQYFIGSSSVPLIYTVAGSGMYGYTGDGGPATLAQTDYPYGVVKDSAGNLYFSDESNHMVRKVAAGTGIISVVAGNGYNGYSGDEGPATMAELGYPMSLALDNGNLFIADNGNATVREVNLSSGTISTYAGSPAATTVGDGGPATAADLYFVGGLAFDASHNLYIAENSLGTIREVNYGTGIITTIAGTGIYGFSGDGGAASSAQFRSVCGLAFDASGSLYIADSGNQLIRKITATNGVIVPASIISTVAGTIPSSQYGYPAGGYSGDGGLAISANLNDPIAVALDKSGNLFISDHFNSVVREVTAIGGIISTVAGNGVLCGTIGGDGGVATGSSLCNPFGIAVDSVGDLLIADEFNRIREVVPAAAPPSTQAATPTFNVAAGNYSNPQSITISDTTPGSSIYFTVDGTTPATGGSAGYSLPTSVTGMVTLKAIASAPGFLTSAPASATYNVSAFSPLITTVAGTGNSGFSGAGGPALSATFAGPNGVAMDKAGNLYVSDSPNNVIWKISATTGTASIYAGTGTAGRTGDGGAAINAMLNYPKGLAFDSTGNLYIADSSNNVIREIAVSTGIISAVAGGAAPTYNGSIGDGGPATSAILQVPATIAFDGNGNLFIADTDNYRVREVSATTGIITTVAGSGTSTGSGDGGPATNAGLQLPDSLAVDKAGNIYVGSSNGARVRKVTAASGQINTIAGFEDLAGDTGDGGQATSAEVYPRSLALDSAGNLYISNWPGEIREINSSTGVIARIAGIGYPGYNGDGGPAAMAQILSPGQVVFDGAGNLYFADSSYRIRKVFLSAQAAATPAFSVPAGTYTASQSVALTDSTQNATIYYTTDGSTPSISSNAYATPITVNSSETINAIAIAVGYNQSAVASASYVVDLQTTPAPSLTSLSPVYTGAGSAQFTLTINGSGFTGASSAYWRNTALTTQFVSSTQLTATVPASDISTAGIVAITVQTPSPGGGTSNTLQFEIDTGGSGTPPSFSTTSATVSAGGTASYPVSLPSSATNVSVNCLNLPAGASCRYSASTGSLTITTTSTTPTGTYVITAVFTETLPGAAAALILLPFLLIPFATKRRKATRTWLIAIAGAITVAAVVAGCGGGGGSSGGTNPSPSTHQVTSSGAVTLIVK